MKKCLNFKVLTFFLLSCSIFGCKTYVPQIDSNVLVKAQNGDPEAQFEMGKIYFESFWQQPLMTKNGTGIKNRDVAEQWFLKAAEQDHIKAKYYLSRITRYYNCNIDCLKQAALEGISDAQYTLGGTYLNDEHGTPKDLALAYKWISLARTDKLTDIYAPRVMSILHLIEYDKISHLEISKGQLMAKEHTEKYGPSKSMIPNH